VLTSSTGEQRRGRGAHAAKTSGRGKPLPDSTARFGDSEMGRRGRKEANEGTAAKAGAQRRLRVFGEKAWERAGEQASRRGEQAKASFAAKQHGEGRRKLAGAWACTSGGQEARKRPHTPVCCVSRLAGDGVALGRKLWGSQAMAAGTWERDRGRWPRTTHCGSRERSRLSPIARLSTNEQERAKEEAKKKTMCASSGRDRAI